MSISILAILVALTGSELEEPVYILEYPGLAFGWIVDEFFPPVEGNLTLENGVIVSEPNLSGVEYHLHYWQEDLAENTRKGDWLEERFKSIISPDLAPRLLMGTPIFTEGSMASPHRLEHSVGLVPVMNFNIVTEEGVVIGEGKASAIFRNGYSILFYSIAPITVDIDVRADLDEMVSMMYMVE